MHIPNTYTLSVSLITQIKLGSSKNVTFKKDSISLARHFLCFFVLPCSLKNAFCHFWPRFRLYEHSRIPVFSIVTLFVKNGLNVAKDVASISTM
jgi:hypothetical protein